jgi:hypothetical protein
MCCNNICSTTHTRSVLDEALSELSAALALASGLDDEGKILAKKLNNPLPLSFLDSVFHLARAHTHMRTRTKQHGMHQCVRVGWVGGGGGIMFNNQTDLVP